MPITDKAYLYAFGVEGGPTKVGHSMAPAKRLKQLQARVGEKLIVTGTWPVGMAKALAAERYAQWLLRAHHISGEWFDAPREQVLAAINAALKGQFDAEYPLPPLDAIGRGWGVGEHITTKFPKGTRERLRAVLGKAGHADFIREAVEAELKRREGKD